MNQSLLSLALFKYKKAQDHSEYNCFYHIKLLLTFKLSMNGIKGSEVFLAPVEGS